MLWPASSCDNDTGGRFEILKYATNQETCEGLCKGRCKQEGKHGCCTLSMYIGACLWKGGSTPVRTGDPNEIATECY